MEELLNAIKEFRQAFVIAVGDHSPFAKTALDKIDAAVQEAAQHTLNTELPFQWQCQGCGAMLMSNENEHCPQCPGNPVS